MQQLPLDDFGSERSGSTILLAEVVALLGRKDYQARVQAFEILYSYYQKPIERYLLMRAHDQELAADLRQKAFTRVWEKFLCMDAILPRTSDHLRNWLYKIAERIAIDDYRRNKQLDSRPLPDSEAYTQLPELRVEEEARTIDRLSRQDEVLRLPPQYRKCLMRKYYWGYSQKEIAVQLGISESTVSEYVSLGKTLLQWNTPEVLEIVERKTQDFVSETLIKYMEVSIFHRELEPQTIIEVREIMKGIKIDRITSIKHIHDK